jgi:hypothetical protein
MERANGPARWPFVAVLFFMTIPGLAVSLVALAALDRLGLWLRGRSGFPGIATVTGPPRPLAWMNCRRCFTAASGTRSINAGLSLCCATMPTTARLRTPASISPGGGS